MTYQLSDYPLVDLLKLRLTIDLEVWRRLWWVFAFLILAMVAYAVVRKLKRRGGTAR